MSDDQKALNAQRAEDVKRIREAYLEAERAVAKAYAIAEKWKEEGKTRDELLQEFGRMLNVSDGGKE
jgi:galactokinase